jgi:hypothetical protein
VAVSRSVWNQLKAITADELIRALEKLLKALLDSTAWTDGDLKRLKLIKRA